MVLKVLQMLMDYLPETWKDDIDTMGNWLILEQVLNPKEAIGLSQEPTQLIEQDDEEEKHLLNQYKKRVICYLELKLHRFNESFRSQKHEEDEANRKLLAEEVKELPSSEDVVQISKYVPAVNKRLLNVWD